MLNLRRSVIVFAVTVSLAAAAVAAPMPTAAEQKQAARKAFVLDVMRSAVALPQPDPQDRLRVLSSATQVAAMVAPDLAHQYAREGAHLEAELISTGETPAVSVMSTGQVDCATAANFVETVPATAVDRAEQSIIGAMTLCPKQALEPARRKLETALNQGVLAARGLLAAMESTGVSTQWSRAEFVKMFASLPDPSKSLSEAPNFGAMYVRMAPEVGEDAARTAGLKFLDWLANVPQGGERNLALNMTTDAMKQALGNKDYEEALRGDVIAQGMAQSAGQPGEIKHPEEEDVSVLKAIDDAGKDQTDALRALPASQRAREAAADGFANGTSGRRALADHYFEMAFSAADEVWANRTPKHDAAAVVEEVSEAAAQVDAVSALARAQHLQDPTAQAIGMLAVARTVLGQQ